MHDAVHRLCFFHKFDDVSLKSLNIIFDRTALICKKFSITFQLSIGGNPGLFVCLFFCFTSSRDWSRNTRAFFNQSDLGSLRLFTLSFLWLLLTFPYRVIGHCHYTGFGFTALYQKVLWYGTAIYVFMGGKVAGNKWWCDEYLCVMPARLSGTLGSCHWTRKLAKLVKLVLLVPLRHAILWVL